VASPLKVEFQFDFGSPNAYLAELAIPGIEQRTGVKFEYVPVLLGGIFKATNNMSPFDSLRGIKNKPEYQALETQRFIRRHNVTKFAHNPFLSGQHADADARRRRGAVREHVRCIFSRRLSPYVG
jgi:2-hydroxychromene-2-carboxylate isomerase